jgi:16S rRNA C967 or C1407 C5-methylase (RsmB/RsmF family)/NOL1/NOP2/fmu family ribosome biogenesis protein
MNNIPESFLKNIEHVLGENSIEFIETLSTPSPISIRLNRFKNTPLLETDLNEKVLWNEQGRYLKERPVFTLDPDFHAGSYYVQEAASMFIEEALKQKVDFNEGLKVLDLCAAPGGKSTLLAGLLNEKSILLANEVIKSRVGVLKENLLKWGYPNYIVSSHDPEEFADLEGFFDIVLVDAPCSGEGLFRKDPKALNEWSLENVNICSMRQKRILRAASMMVAPGGILIYSTCTYNESENLENAKWLGSTFDFEPVKVNLKPEWNISELEQGYQFFPHKNKGEGFYMAMFQQKSYDQNYITGKIVLNKLPRKNLDLIRSWMNLSSFDQYEYFLKAEGTIVAIPQDLIPVYSSIFRALDKRSSGLEIGILKGDDFIPSHALALSTALNQNVPSIELEKDDALKYLKKELNEIPLDTPNNKGWVLVKYNKNPLGWIKIVGNRINNYLPKEWRIRMEIE